MPLSRIVIVILACFACPSLATAMQANQDTAPFRLESTVLAEPAALPVVWAYSSIDAPAPDTSQQDDTGWTLLDARLPADAPLPPSWQGLGWFRLWVSVDSTLVGEPLALRVQQYGAATIYLDGEPLATLGQPSPAAASEHAHANPSPISLVFKAPGLHVLAVRYSNHSASRLHRVNYDAGFHMQIGRAEALIGEHMATVRGGTMIQYGLSGMYMVFGLIHLFFFIFFPQRKENLFFALIAFCIGVVLFNNFHEALFFRHPWEIILIRRLWPPITLFTVLVFLRLIYSAYKMAVPRLYYVWLGVGVVLGVWGWINPNLGWANPAGGRTYAYFFALIIEMDMLRVLLGQTLGKRRNPDLFAWGGLALILAYSYPLMVVLGFIPPFLDLLVFPNVVITGWLLATSLYLSRSFAHTNATLEQKLAEVTALSQEKLAQERQLQAQKLERKLLEAEYEQKLRDLEEARELQLSMLPKALPEHPDLELAAYMETATEVGGDYYDFTAQADGTLTLAIGDATGHGMRAGTMVTATKSLFGLLSADANLLGILNRATRALKRLNMHKLYMALTLARYEDGRLRLATAGMPATLVYRAATQEVESILLKGMPLGSFVSFPYADAEVTLSPGDTVLFMSDGFPELFNEHGQMLGYDEAAQVFAEIGHLPPEEIISQLLAASTNWRQARQLDDDMTFVVLKRTVTPTADLRKLP